MKKIIIILSICFCKCLFSADTTFLIIRHGQTDWNITERAQGHTNNPLNAHGLIQAKNLAEKIVSHHSDIASIYSSDLDRAYVTAQETAKKLNLEVEKRIALREINNGEAEGLTPEEEEALYGTVLQELNERYPHYSERGGYTHIPDAETDNQLLKRIENELKIIAERHPDEKIAVFVHGHIIKVLLTHILDSEKIPPVPNCAVVQVVYSSDVPSQPFKFVSIE